MDTFNHKLEPEVILFYFILKIFKTLELKVITKIKKPPNWGFKLKPKLLRTFKLFKMDKKMLARPRSHHH